MGRGPGPEGSYRLFADRLLVHMESRQREIVRITGRSTESIGQGLGETVVEPAQALSKDRRLLSGFGVVRIRQHDQAGDESAEERLAPAAGVVDELEEAEIGWQLLLRDATVRPQPGA